MTNTNNSYSSAVVTLLIHVIRKIMFSQISGRNFGKVAHSCYKQTVYTELSTSDTGLVYSLGICFKYERS